MARIVGCIVEPSVSYRWKIWPEDKATWLFDLAHSGLDEDAIVKGFLKHYALQGRSIGDVQQDFHFHTHYGDFYLELAMASLRRALEFQIDASRQKGGITWAHWHQHRG